MKVRFKRNIKGIRKGEELVLPGPVAEYWILIGVAEEVKNPVTVQRVRKAETR